MSSQSEEIILDLRVDAVTCPGVWLYPKGLVCLSITAFDKVIRTTQLPPIFPLCFKETFFFRKWVHFDPQNLALLIDFLDDEVIYCELIQSHINDDNCRHDRILAHYTGLIGDILFPSLQTCRFIPGVDLLMKPSEKYPGILAPKIEITPLIRTKSISLNYPIGKKTHSSKRLKLTSKHRYKEAEEQTCDSGVSSREAISHKNTTQTDHKMGQREQFEIQRCQICSGHRIENKKKSHAELRNSESEPCIICNKYYKKFF